MNEPNRRPGDVAMEIAKSQIQRVELFRMLNIENRHVRYENRPVKREEKSSNKNTTLQTSNIAVFTFHLGSFLNRFGIGLMGEYSFLGEEDPDLISESPFWYLGISKCMYLL